MRLPPLNYRSLLILYGASVITMLPFAIVYVYVHEHDWHQSSVAPVLFAVSVACALIVWARLEPSLLAHQPPTVNLNAMAPEKVFGVVLATSVAAVVFTPPAVVSPFCRTAKRTRTSSSLVFESGMQSDSSVPVQDAAPTTAIVP